MPSILRRHQDLVGFGSMNLTLTKGKSLSNNLSLVEISTGNSFLGTGTWTPVLSF